MNKDRLFSKNDLFGVAAAILFGIYPSVQKCLIEQGMSEFASVVYGDTAGFILCLLVCAVKRIPLKIPVKQGMALGLLGIAGMGSTAFLQALAFRYIPVGNVTVLHFLYPSLVTVASIILFRRKANALSAAAILISILGVALTSSLSTGGNISGYLLAIASAFTYAAYLVGSERFSRKELPVWLTLCYMSGASAIFYCGIGLGTHAMSIPQDGNTWLLLLLMCGLHAAAYAFLNIGVARTGAVHMAFITLIEPIASVVCSAIVFRDKITGATALGCILILVSVWLNSKSGESTADKDRRAAVKKADR